MREVFLLWSPLEASLDFFALVTTGFSIAEDFSALFFVDFTLLATSMDSAAFLAAAIFAAFNFAGVCFTGGCAVDLGVGSAGGLVDVSASRLPGCCAVGLGGWGAVSDRVVGGGWLCGGFGRLGCRK